MLRDVQIKPQLGGREKSSEICQGVSLGKNRKILLLISIRSRQLKVLSNQVRKEPQLENREKSKEICQGVSVGKTRKIILLIFIRIRQLKVLSNKVRMKPPLESREKSNEITFYCTAITHEALLSYYPNVRYYMAHELIFFFVV